MAATQPITTPLLRKRARFIRFASAWLAIAGSAAALSWGVSQWRYQAVYEAGAHDEMLSMTAQISACEDAARSDGYLSKCLKETGGLR